MSFEKFLSHELEDLKTFAASFSIDASTVEKWFTEKRSLLRQRLLWKKFVVENNTLFGGRDADEILRDYSMTPVKRVLIEEVESVLKKVRESYEDTRSICGLSLYESFSQNESPLQEPVSPLYNPEPVSPLYTPPDSPKRCPPFCAHEQIKSKTLHFPFCGQFNEGYCEAIARNCGLFSQCEKKISERFQDSKLCNECGKAWGTSKWTDFIDKREDFITGVKEIGYLAYLEKKNFRFPMCCIKKFASSKGIYFDESSFDEQFTI